MIGYCFGRNCPHRGVACRSLFSYCGGDHERACFDRVQNPESFFQCLFKEKVLSIFYQLRLEERSRPEGRVPQLLMSRFPQMGMKEGHFGFSSQKAGVAHSVEFPLDDMSYRLTEAY